MRTERNFLITGLVLLLTLLAFSFGLGSAAQASSSKNKYSITDALKEIHLQEDGSLIVSLNLFVEFSGSTTHAAFYVPAGEDRYVKVLSVADGTGKEYKPGASIDAENTKNVSGTYGSAYDGDYRKIVWHSNFPNSSHWFTIRYRLEGATKVYNDIVEINSNLWSKKTSVKELDVYIHHPEVSPENELYQVFFSPIDSKIETKKTSEITYLQAKDVSAKTTFQLTLPRQAVGEINSHFVPVSNSNQMPVIVKQHQEKLVAFNSSFNQLKRHIHQNAVVYSAILVLLIVGWFFLCVWLARRREESLVQEIKMSSSIPDKASPFEAYALVSRGKTNESAIIASFVNLARRGFYDSELKGDLLLFSIPDKRPNKTENHEKQIIDFFDKLFDLRKQDNNSTQASLQDLSQTAKANPQEVVEDWSTLEFKLEKQAEALIDFDKSRFYVVLYLFGATLLSAIAGLLAVGTALSDTLFLRADEGGSALFLVPLLVFILATLLFVFPRNWFRTLERKTAQRIAAWSAFEQWTEKLPKLENVDLPSYKRWPGIMEYAIAFGTAEQIAKTGIVPDGFYEEDTKDNSDVFLFFWASQSFSENTENNSLENRSDNFSEDRKEEYSLEIDSTYLLEGNLSFAESFGLDAGGFAFGGAGGDGGGGGGGDGGGGGGGGGGDGGF